MLRMVLLTTTMMVAFAAAKAQAGTETVDARKETPAPEVGYLKLGASNAPDGTILGVNSQYLTLNGKPWLPVMGEIHFVRLPEAEWDQSLAKIKASGIDIIATYMFWDYHEEMPGQFNWSGQHDVRRFVELAAKNGLKVVVRLGPWAHGEARFGGIPDWVVREVPLRGSDPVYLGYVDRYWSQIGAQLKGLLWKDGGPIIGVQLENEYNLTGPLQGREHIADLKSMALKHGFDVPFYTVTGWDGAVYPRREVTPVFGGYPDEPWAVGSERLAPKETYVFRFNSRVSGNLGAQTQGAGGDADPDIPHTPFLGAEYAGGLPIMYRRRTLVDPDDIAAMVPVQLGSGVNLYGYYMYHGGSNLIGRTTLQENTAIGGFNDLPIIDYDFQAPFGAFGQANPVAAAIRPFHYFLQSYGARLAPMSVREPRTIPAQNDDLQTLRWSARAKDDAAFVFVNNHVRQYRTPDHPGTRFSVELPHGTVTFPTDPVNIPSGAYFIWPVGLDLGGTLLSWASAQPVTVIDADEGTLHVFKASDGIVPEFAFPAGTKVQGGTARQVDGRIVVRVPKPGTQAVLTITANGKTARILVLSAAQANRLWQVQIAGKASLVLTGDQLVTEGETLSFTSRGDPDFSFSVWPALPVNARANLKLSPQGKDGLLTRYSAHAEVRRPVATLTQIKPAGAAPPVNIGGPAKAAVEPYPETFGKSAAAWKIELSKDVLKGVDDAFLKIDWTGDIGRLFADDMLIEDQYFYGPVWQIGLNRHAAQLSKPLILRIMPLRGDAPIYIDERVKPKFEPTGQIAKIHKVAIEPQYRLTVQFPR